MKENKNNKLQADALESVAGGGDPFTAEDVQEMYSGLDKLLTLAQSMPEDNPDRVGILKAAAKLSRQINEISKIMSQELYKRGEALNSVENSLRRPLGY